MIAQAVAKKRWTPAQKLRIVEESMQPGNSASSVAQQHGVSPALLYKWRKLMFEGGAAAVEANEQVVSMSEVTALKKRKWRKAPSFRRLSRRTPLSGRV